MVNHTMSTPTTSSNKQTLIIVGNGMVGHHFAEQLVESGALAGFDVTATQSFSARVLWTLLCAGLCIAQLMQFPKAVTGYFAASVPA